MNNQALRRRYLEAANYFALIGSWRMSETMLRWAREVGE